MFTNQLSDRCTIFDIDVPGIVINLWILASDFNYLHAVVGFNNNNNTHVHIDFPSFYDTISDKWNQQ
jgi:hypothetical protein